LIEKMRHAPFVKKYSVQFVSPSGKASQPFYFFTRYNEDVSQTWQVLRSEFDVMLVEHARARGATIVEGVTVTDLLKENGRFVGLRTRLTDGLLMDYQAPITLDCSGKDSFAASRNHWRMRDPKLNKVAVWTYYKGAARDPGIDAGGTTVAFVPEKGWFWYIPLHNDMVSVGVVAEAKYLTRQGIREPGAIFQREIDQNAWIKEHLACGTQIGQYYITNEFTFHARHCGSEGLLLVGDAFCFLDPVFSSGLMFALKSGVLAGDYVHDALVDSDFSPARFEGYATTLREGIENMRRLVYAFYDQNFSFRELTDRYPELADDLTDCLSGDVNKDYTRLFRAISEFAEIPDPLPYGQPLVPRTVVHHPGGG
jgi:flavin-dependent dehydrogenase